MSAQTVLHPTAAEGETGHVSGLLTAPTAAARREFDTPRTNCTEEISIRAVQSNESHEMVPSQARKKRT